MSGTRSIHSFSALATVAALVVAVATLAPRASAQGAEVAWRLEQPKPPPSPTGEEAAVPIGLGRTGDIEFWAPNRGLLMTAGNPPTIPPGVWAYNGREWHELANACGATDGRIAWAGPEEFWTISDGRPGQATSEFGTVPPLEDNTLCHFAHGQVVASYAHPAFQVDSYQAMHAAGCITASDCWFGGAPLPAPQVGAFQLHWNGNALEAEPYPAEGHAIEDVRPFDEHLYESVRISSEDRVIEEGQLEVPVLHRINPEGVRPTLVPERGLPLGGEEPNPLDFLHLSAAEGALAHGAAEGALWAAAGGSLEGGGQVTVIRRSAGKWSQLLGPKTQPSGAALFPGDVVSAIAAEPGGGGAWVGLDSRTDAQKPSPTATALIAHISATGTVSETQTLPAGGGPKGAVARIACPAANDCWLATTQGWLFHLAPENEEKLAAVDEDPAFKGLITYRPPDQGLAQVPPDAPPVDDSGLGEEPPPYGTLVPQTPKPEAQARVAVPLLSHLHSRLVHGTTLELRFRLAVRARVRLIAKRHRQVVAATPMRTLTAGERRLLLGLDRRRWPTKLAMQTHALAKLPTVPAGESGGGGGGAGANTVSTGLVVLPHTPSFSFAGSGPLL